MGHLPTRTRSGHRLLPLLGLFVLLKVGSSPNPTGAVLPEPALPRPRSARREPRAPGSDGRAARSSDRAAWRTLCCPCVCVFPAVLRDSVEEYGSFAASSFHPLCSFTAADTHISGDLLDNAFLGKRRSLSLLVVTYCTPMLLNLSILPQPGVRLLCLNLPSAGIIHRGLSSVATNGLMGVGREHGFL